MHNIDSVSYLFKYQNTQIDSAISSESTYRAINWNLNDGVDIIL